MKGLKEFLNESTNREPNIGERFYNTDKPKWSKNISWRIEDAMRRLQRPITCTKEIPISYLKTSFDTRRYKEWVTNITRDEYGIVLHTSDSKISVYIPLDNTKTKLKYWIEDEELVSEILDYIEDFDFED